MNNHVAVVTDSNLTLLDSRSVVGRVENVLFVFDLIEDLIRGRPDTELTNRPILDLKIADGVRVVVVDLLEALTVELHRVLASREELAQIRASRARHRSRPCTC